MAEDTNKIEMLDEEGNLLEFEHLLTFEVDDQFYIAFTPYAAIDGFEVGEVLIMRIEEDDEQGDIYLPIETEEELDKLWAIFQELYYADEDEEEGEEQ